MNKTKPPKTSKIIANGILNKKKGKFKTINFLMRAITNPTNPTNKGNKESMSKARCHPSSKKINEFLIKIKPVSMLFTDIPQNHFPKVNIYKTK
jgi:hypothetical protein